MLCEVEYLYSQTISLYDRKYILSEASHYRYKTVYITNHIFSQGIKSVRDQRNIFHMSEANLLIAAYLFLLPPRNVTFLMSTLRLLPKNDGLLFINISNNNVVTNVVISTCCVVGEWCLLSGLSIPVFSRNLCLRLCFLADSED